MPTEFYHGDEHLCFGECHGTCRSCDVNYYDRYDEYEEFYEEYED